MLKEPGIIVAPGAYDALSAKIIEKAGLKAYNTQAMEPQPRCLECQI